MGGKFPIQIAISGTKRLNPLVLGFRATRLSAIFQWKHRNIREVSSQGHCQIVDLKGIEPKDLFKLHSL